MYYINTIIKYIRDIMIYTCNRLKNNYEEDYVHYTIGGSYHNL